MLSVTMLNVVVLKDVAPGEGGWGRGRDRGRDGGEGGA